MVRNDPIPDCKFYIYATNKVMTRTGREFGYGKMIDLWCADSSFEAQDAVNTLRSSKTYTNPEYSSVKPKFSSKVSVAVTTHKPEFVFGNERHQEHVRNFEKNAEIRRKAEEELRQKFRGKN